MIEDTLKATHIEVRAKVRYWEDATVNGAEDLDGTLIPFRDGDLWCPRIRLADGLIEGWPQGMVASIHFKVCDEGEYWLTNSGGARVAKWHGHYVPDEFMCHGSSGYGDYIIIHVGGDGVIAKWRQPIIEAGKWVSP